MVCFLRYSLGSVNEATLSIVEANGCIQATFCLSLLSSPRDFQDAHMAPTMERKRIFQKAPPPLSNPFVKV